MSRAAEAPGERRCDECGAEKRTIGYLDSEVLEFRPATFRAAIAYTVLACCRMHGVDPYACVSDVLRKIADGWPQARLDEILPQNWAAATAKTG